MLAEGTGRPNPPHLRFLLGGKMLTPYQKYAASYRASSRKYRAKNPEKILAWRLVHANKLRADNTVRRNELRIETLSHYSPNNVLCCSWMGCLVDDVDMLVLDHINDDGAVQRKNGCGRGWNLYRGLKKQNFPAGYQTLCCNHNHKKELLRARKS